MNNWQLQEAKAKLSELVRNSQSSPQIITVRGKEVSVVISIKDYQELNNKKGSLVDLMRNSPLCGIELDLKRDQSKSRQINL
jgi:prevent-host-death family protein